MTGFGSGRAETPTATVTLEIRSVNHRYCDVRVHAPPGLMALMANLEREVRARIRRGRIDVSVVLERANGIEVPVEVDVGRARALAEAYRRLAGALGVEASTPLDWIAAAPNVVMAGDGVPSMQELEPVARRALDVALGELIRMRESEGVALAGELERRLSRVRALVDGIRARAPQAVGDRGQRLRERVNALLDEVAADEGRLAQEIALLADRADVTEEVDRLTSHVAQFRVQLNAPDVVGRRLDFLVQEMNREANTIGSKGQDAPMAHLVVELKTELERIREQVQNLE